MRRRIFITMAVILLGALVITLSRAPSIAPVRFLHFETNLQGVIKAHFLMVGPRDRQAISCMQIDRKIAGAWVKENSLPWYKSELTNTLSVRLPDTHEPRRVVFLIWEKTLMDHARDWRHRTTSGGLPINLSRTYFFTNDLPASPPSLHAIEK